MAEDTVEDVREYLARDENKARVQFTVSLEGRSSDELMALLRSRKEMEEEDCRGCGSTKSSNRHGGVSTAVGMDGDSVNTQHFLSIQQEEVAVSSVTSAERIVEVSQIEPTHDGFYSQLRDVEGLPCRQEEHSALWHAVRSGKLVSKEELEEVQREMITHERVVKALEQDNASLHVERRMLRVKLSEMEKKVVDVEAKCSILASGPALNPRVVYPAPPIAVVSSNENHQLGQNEIQMELERQKTLARELQLELELLRREKKDLETRLACLDAKKLEEMELELRNLRVDLKRKETEHHETVKDMARKIAWYVEHQEFNRSQEELLKEQQDTIRRLRTRLHEMGGFDGEGKNMRIKKDARVQYLTKRVVELEEALDSKHPNSIAQLIRSCQPSVQDSKLFKQLNLRIKELEETLVEKDRCAEAAVTRLRVETDRMKILYQEKIEKLEEELKLRLLHAQTRRVRDLEKQLAEAREVIREMEREKASFAAASMESVANTGNSQVQKTNSELPVEGEVKPPMLGLHASVSNSADEIISLLRKENSALQSQLSEALQLATRTTASSAVLTQGLETGVISSHVISGMQAQITTLNAELAVYKRLLSESQESLRDAHARWDEQLTTARREYQSQIQRARQQHNEDITRIEEHHQRELNSINEKQRGSEEFSWAFHKLAKNPRGELKCSHAFLQSVAERLTYIERRQVQKEREAAHEIAEIKRVADFELTLAKQKSEMLVEHKNQQIQEFRLQLDQLLSSLALLQAHA